MTMSDSPARRRIAIVTATRAEYGLLYWLMREIEADPLLELQVLVTGAHLSPEFGHTVDLIVEAGFPIGERVEMLLSSDSPVAMGKSLGLATIGFSEALQRLRPQVVVVLGDRYELLAVAAAAMVHRIPLAHIHGGESSEGVVDELVRHAISKMSHLHFVAAHAYGQRLIRMGEDPARVFNVGAPGLDHLTRTPLLDRTTWQQQTGFVLHEKNILVTLHPEADGGMEGVEALLAALDRFPECGVVVTGSNADAGGRAINQRLKGYAACHGPRVAFFTNLGTVAYLSLLSWVDVMVGNSSSGIIEAPAMGTPVVNMGQRQKGRLRAPAVVDCLSEVESLVGAIHLALSAEFRQQAARRESPYGRGTSSQQMATLLREIPLEGLLNKSFYDGVI
ncbi:MAG: UDP-N-acetylglucosamine 2-epimerase (hydrolyzing) [Magnetococcales bacterium]|nr:UDP-N-acetylglucosamine 2-epimerase (hydrolyzing) [Magnetococcales bacterium]